MFSPASLRERNTKGSILEARESRRSWGWLGEEGKVLREEEEGEGEGGERGRGEAFVAIWSESRSRKHAGSRRRVIAGE